MSEGVLIDERFLLGQVVRESGVAIVYEAMHRNGASAWLKLPRGPEHAQSIAIEAAVANALGKNAVSVRDDGTTKEGIPYLVLEPVTGQRLDHWRAASGGRAPPDEAMGLGDELCQAIGTMHAAGYAIALLRTDAIIVLPKGGMCLLELEHATGATPSLVKEDVARVGRVLYEMLSGMPCLAASPPLHDAAPELPLAMTSTVDDAARGRFSTIGELRAALRASRPDWLGPMRRPMPSVPPEGHHGEGVRRQSSKPSQPFFNPRDLVESQGRLEAAPEIYALAPVVPAATMRLPMISELDAPPVAAFYQPPPPPPPAPTSKLLIVAGVFSGGLLLATLALAFFLTRGETVVATTTAMAPSASALPVAKASPPPAPPAASASAVVADVIDADEPSPVKSVAPGEVDAGAPRGEATFRFEGDRFPRLVIVDGKTVGVTTKPVHVRCGPHSVKIGGKGIARTLALPCEGEQRIVIEPNGVWRVP